MIVDHPKAAMSDINWEEYYKGTAGNPPNPLLLKALTYVRGLEKAIDLGAGALNETRYLLAQGFDVTTVDSSPLVEQMARSIGSPRLHPFTGSFEDFDFPEDEYDLVVAMFALPFLESHFEDVFTKVKASLKVGGVFCGQFFGDRDQRKNHTNRTFHTKEQVLELIGDLEILTFEEEERLKGDMNSHIFHVIARKR